MTDRAYLDHASTSPLRPEARAALVAALDVAGDPGRIHAEGLTARVTVEQARQQVADLLGARPREVVFTSGATEAIAAACWGASHRGRHQVVPAVEHSAVRQAAARHGEVTTVRVDGQGRVDVEDLLAAAGDDTALVHLQWGNHEVGTTQPVAEAVAACRARGVLVHVDAAQAAGRVPVAFRALGADLMSVSAHKLGGPAGVGALLVRQGLRLPPLLVGGDQERARRAGLENVPGIAGFGAACAALAAATAAPPDARTSPPPDAATTAPPDARTTPPPDAATTAPPDAATTAPRGGPPAAPPDTATTAPRGGPPSGPTTASRGGPPSGPTTASRGGPPAAPPGGIVLEVEAAEQRRLTGRILAALGTSPDLEGLHVYGDPDDRLPHLVCLGVEGIEPQAVLLGLDRAGIAAHSGSACASESLEPSPVLEAMGVDAHHSLRLSAGWSTTDADIDRLLDALPRVLAELRALTARAHGA